MSDIDWELYILAALAIEARQVISPIAGSLHCWQRTGLCQKIIDMIYEGQAMI